MPEIKASILIVDDKPQNLLVLAEMLGSLNQTVVQAQSGAEALRHLLKQDFSIVLVDVRMPDMDGYELASLIRQRDRSRDLPIIFITAYSRDDADISRGYALGAVDYVFKPIDPVVLRAKVSVFVDLYKKTEMIRRQSEIERRLEQQLLQSQKMEAVGQLTGGIAHDFNNMLSVVIWNLDRIAQSLPEGRLQEQARLAMSGALNCAELTRQLLTFARHQPDQPKPLDLLEVSPRLSKLFGPVIGKHVRIEIRMSDDLWPVYADPARIESALLNLVINARDAMPEGGSIIIEGVNVPKGELPLDPSGEYVAVSIIDSGMGMSQEVIDRAFEPFFTTKPAGEGTGLGLSMVYAFAKQARGHVRIESQPGKGTSVCLYLPRSVDLPVDERDGGGDVDQSRRILVVEDDADVRAVTIARLEEFGYRVYEADCGAAAVKILRGDAPLDLVFTDVVMPGGMSGLDLARRALELRPGIKVVFTSGYASSFHGTSEIMGELLQKPYSEAALKRTLRRALEESRPVARRAMSVGAAR